MRYDGIVFLDRSNIMICLVFSLSLTLSETFAFFTLTYMVLSHVHQYVFIENWPLLALETFLSLYYLSE